MASAESSRDVVAFALARARAAGAYQAEVALSRGEAFDARVRTNEIDFVKQSREQSLGVRVYVGGRGGLSAAAARTSDLSRDVVARTAADAVALARATVPDACAGLPDGGFATDAPDLELFAPGDRPFEPDSRIAAARAMEGAAHAFDPRISDSEGSQAHSGFGEIAYGNSAGFFGEYASARHTIFAESLAKSDGVAMQRDAWYSSARSWGALDSAASVGRRAAERALRRLGARRVPTCEVPVVFDPTTAPSLLRQLAGCASGYAIYRGASFLAGRLGQTIASPAVTIVDDARLRGGLGSRPFDGDGLPTRRNVLVDRGRLASYVLDTYAARKLGLRSTGNAVRGGGASPGNLWLEPGAKTPEEIIASTPRGLYVTDLIGQGFNPVTGDYSRGATGMWIENGELAFPVEEITIASNFGQMLRDIDAIGSDLIWFGATAAPTLRVARMTVAGS
ncbi:MAG TPA: TldD/PmbA family protein [Myxococcota bacterium]|nr:TldD/PmbA family protein [Myxococcota bacterium]